MRVNKYKGKVFGASMTAKEQEAMNIEISKQIAEKDKLYYRDLSILILYALHKHLGFGKKRLKRFYLAFNEEHKALTDHYEMPGNENDVWLSNKKLEEIGVYVDEWEAERLGNSVNN